MTHMPLVVADCHTHVWLDDDHLGGAFVADAQRAWGPEMRLGTTLREHESQMAAAGKAVVLAFDAPACGVVVPNEYVADYVASNPKLVGFASVDPNRADAISRLEAAVSELGLSGLKIAPIYQDFDPVGKRALKLFASAEELGIPVLWHQGTSFVRAGPLKFSNPILVDEIATRFPNLKIVVAHLGHPWINETVVVVRKQPHVFADISGLHPRPWQLYTGLLTALEYGVMDKLLFGSDFPFFTIEQTVGGLRSITKMGKDSPLPEIPAPAIEDILVRDAFAVLGLESQRA